MFKRIREKLFGEPTIYLYSEETPEEQDITDYEVVDYVTIEKRPPITKEREKELRDEILYLNSEINWAEHEYEIFTKKKRSWKSAPLKHSETLKMDLFTDLNVLIKERNELLNELYG